MIGYILIGGCENDLVLNGGYYFVNVQNSSYGIAYVVPDTFKNNSKVGGTSGIRPVMTLKNELHIYKIYDEAEDQENEHYHWEFAD